MRVLILGGYGAVGARILAGLREGGHQALAAGRDPDRAGPVLDLTDQDWYRRAVAMQMWWSTSPG